MTFCDIKKENDVIHKIIYTIFRLC